jgi:arylsulfatase A-like enzyme
VEISQNKSPLSLNRRDFIYTSAAVAASQFVAVPGSKAEASLRPPKSKGKKNILFIFTDQESRLSALPIGYRLPGHDYLASKGTEFMSHHIAAAMCTSSRSIMLTGLQTADNKMFDNTDLPYVGALSKKIPTIGHMLQKAGYYTAYKGKWHLDAAFENPGHEKLLLKEMEDYGFSDFYSLGDSVAHEDGGFNFDHITAGSAITWLRRKGRGLQDQGKPWSLFVSLINPHDIMYFNADAENESVQDTGHLLMRAARAPKHKAFEPKWRQPVAESLRQPLDEVGRPRAHWEFDRAWGYTLGRVPLKEANWQRFQDFYLNSIKMADAQLHSILLELELSGLSKDTIIVFTSDHGEMGGHHGLRGKGPFAYKEVLNVPFYVVHPDVKGGRKCEALTSHIDIVPTLLSFAGLEKGQVPEYAQRELPGFDLSPVISNPSGAKIHDARDKVLFTYSGIATNDSELIRIVTSAKAKGENPKLAIAKERYLPDLKKRGSVRTVFDGRYKFSRYFSPVERNSPKSLAEIFATNDVELFDHKSDPSELKNLAIDRGTNSEIILAMNNKLEAAIQHEIGKDDGREMPNIPLIDWSVDRFDL